MRRLLTGILFFFAAVPLAARMDGRDIVLHALAAMGGEDRLRAIHVVVLKGIGHHQALEQSERPEGPWVEAYEQVTEVRDFDHGRLRDDIEARGYETADVLTSAAWTRRATMIDGGLAFDVTNEQHPAPGRGRDVQGADESLAFGPERLLLTALDAHDLRRLPDAALHGFVQHVVHFSRGGTSVRIWISRTTFYPAAVELIRPRPYDIFWSPWGDVTTRVTWNLWNLEPNGVHYPREWTAESNGLPERSLSIQEVHFDPPLSAETFPAVDSLRDAARKRIVAPDDFPLGKPAEIAPGIVQISGFWNVTEVRENDGVVILEGPISNGYSEKVLAEAAARFPGVPVKAVITTSDAWPHIGGLREYVARGIEIVALDLNAPILRRLAAAPHRARPDALQRRPRAPKFRLIIGRTRFGTMELIPLRTVTGERQMAVWFPERRLLYTSDLFQKMPDGTWFTPQTVSELVSVVAREHLDPVTIFGMHYGPTPWSDAADSLRKTPAAP